MVVAFCCVILALAAASDFDSAPPAPGYKSQSEVMAAVLLKKVKLVQQAPVEVPENVEEIRDLEYFDPADSKPLRLNLYLPKNRKSPLPTLVFIHGGGWATGGPDDYKFYTVAYAAKGYAAASISYRLVGKAPYPACVQDCRNAIRWLKSNAAKYGLDPDRIAAIGGSAGGHLSMMLGYAPAEVPDWDKENPFPGISPKVQAVINFYGPSDLTDDLAKTNSTVIRFFGGKKFAEAGRDYQMASPLTHLDKSDPPTLILHGTIDEIVSVEQSDRLAARLKDLGIPVVYDRLEGWPHTMDMAEVVNRRSQYFMDHFLEKYFTKTGAGKSASP